MPLSCTLGLNTYGLCSINSKTFNQSYDSSLTYPKKSRDVIVTALRLYNATFSALGFIPGVRFYSGCTRMLVGAAIVAITLAIGEKKGDEGIIIGKWYDEALATGCAQLARGAFEAFVPYGQIVNFTLACVATYYNILATVTTGSEGFIPLDCVVPHKDPSENAIMQLI